VGGRQSARGVWSTSRAVSAVAAAAVADSGDDGDWLARMRLWEESE